MQALCKFLGTLLRFLGLQNVIIIEAERIMRENTLAVFQEMLRRGWNKRYRIVLVAFNPEPVRLWSAKNMTIVKRPKIDKNPISLMRTGWLFLRACLIIDENKQIRKWNPLAVHVFLTHGSPVKYNQGYYTCWTDTDYALCQSEFWRPIVSRNSPIPPDRRVILGQPRNDAFFTSDVSMPELFGEGYKKVVVWYPTFRQRRNPKCPQNLDGAALPVVHDEMTARKINEAAAKYGVLIVLKPHPVQDISRIKALDLDHLKLIHDDFFVSHGISSYAFLGKTDALITDYSSVIFDYLLTGKPIALAQEDYEEYEKKVGFAVDMELLRSCAVKLESAQDFESFFRDLTEGNDPLREKREELMHLTNKFADGNSAKRVVDWFEEILSKK